MAAFKTQFRLSTVFLVMAITSLSIAWWLDHTRLQKQLDGRDATAILDALQLAGANKHYQWSPSVYLNTDTSTIESDIRLHLPNPTGDSVTSKMGWSTAKLRRPTTETTDAVLVLLQHEDTSVRLKALQLIALYSEAFMSLPAYDDTLAARTHFRNSVSPRLFELLTVSDSNIRAHAALAIGYSSPWRTSIDNLAVAYKRETDSTAKLYIAWSMAKQF